MRIISLYPRKNIRFWIYSSSPEIAICLCEESHSKAFLLIKFLGSFEVWIFYWEYSSWEFLSFTQEWIFVFKLIVLHKKLTLLVWRITFRSNLADKVFVLFWGLNILLRRILRLNWVLLSYWKGWFFSNTVNYTEFQFIWFYLFLHTINRI